MLQHHASIERASPSRTPATGPAGPEQPSLIRQEIAELVRIDQISQARQLAQNALQLYPGHEDILVIHALVCEMQQDWPEAEKSLRELVQTQMLNVPEETWRHWIRVLQCCGHMKEAMDAAYAATQQHPSSHALKYELEALNQSPPPVRAAA